MNTYPNPNRLAATAAVLFVVLIWPVHGKPQEPSAEETVEYINEKLAVCGDTSFHVSVDGELMRISGNNWTLKKPLYGETHWKTAQREANPYEITVKLADLSSDIRRVFGFSRDAHGIPADALGYRVKINIPCAIRNCSQKAPSWGISSTTLETQIVEWIKPADSPNHVVVYMCEDDFSESVEDSAKRVQKAFVHLIEISGGGKVRELF